MTVTTTYAPATYTGDGSTVAFALNHTVLEESHVVVTVNGAVQVSGYTVSGVGGAGITVTFSSAPANGASIIIERIVPYTQNTDLENFDGNPADVTEKQFDLFAMADQQIAEEQGRNIVLPIGASVTTNQISGTITALAKILTINSSGPVLSEISQFGNLDVIASSPQNGDLLVYNGTNWTNLKNNLSASTAPTVNDDSGDGYSVSSRWYDTTADEAYVCLDATVGAADWKTTTLESGDLGSAALVSVESLTIQNYLTGLTLSNAADADHDITISAGQASDSTNAKYLKLAAAITKQIDAAWAEGSAAGGLFTGTVANNTTYHVFIIEKDSDGSIDAGFDTSITAANIPSGYTRYRRVASVITDGAANIINFKQYGDYFEFNEFQFDVNDTTVGTTAELQAVTVPNGIECEANISYAISGTAGRLILFSSPNSTDEAPATTTSSVIVTTGDNAATALQNNTKVWTDTSQQIRYRSSGALTFLRISTRGYVDMRGR